jgi:activator of HSP90 ATPase
MTESIQFSFDLPVYPERVYRAWLDSYEHSQFTGKPAQIHAVEDGEYTAYDGYIRGKNLVLSPFSRIVQTWRTREFAASDPDHRVEIQLEPTCTGTQFTLSHEGIPANESQKYLQAWEEKYFRPLLKYFEEIVGEYVADMGDG